MADRPHNPAVEFAQRRFGDRRQRVAVVLVPAPADRQRLPVDREAGTRGRGLYDPDAFGNDFETDVVAEQNADFQHDGFQVPAQPTIFTPDRMNLQAG